MTLNTKRAGEAPPTVKAKPARGPGGLDPARRAEIGEARRMRTRAALIDAAIAVLGEEDGRFASVDDIIKRAEVARGTFYNHFDSKDQFLDAVAFELSHEFNLALDKSIGGKSDPALRAATWTRQYLRRMRLDPHWGWAVINVGLNGSHLLGEETHRAVRSNTAVGTRLGVFTVPSRDAALDLSVGTVFASAFTVLRGQTKPDHPEATAYMLLLGLGVPPERAAELVREPLPPIPRFEPR